MSSRAGVAAVLSFVIPGLGQLYNGNFIRAAFWLLIAFWAVDNPMAWPFEAGFWQWMGHFLPALTAYHKARQVELIAAWRAEMMRRVGGQSGGGHDDNNSGSGRIIDQ